MKPIAKSQPRSAAASSLTMLAQTLGCRLPLVKTIMAVSLRVVPLPGS